MTYSSEQLAQGLYLIHELELMEIERKRQKAAMPWINFDEAIAFISERLTWPLGMAAGVIDALFQIGCVRKSLHGGFFKPIKPVLPSEGEQL